MLRDPAAVGQRDIYGTTLWAKFSVLVLREVKRATGPVLTSVLSKVRLGICDEEVTEMLKSCLRPMILKWSGLWSYAALEVVSLPDSTHHCVKSGSGQ